VLFLFVVLSASVYISQLIGWEGWVFCTVRRHAGKIVSQVGY